LKTELEKQMAEENPLNERILENLRKIELQETSTAWITT